MLVIRIIYSLNIEFNTVFFCFVCLIFTSVGEWLREPSSFKCDEDHDSIVAIYVGAPAQEI